MARAAILAGALLAACGESAPEPAAAAAETAAELDATTARVDRVNWIAGEAPTAPIEARVQIRYRHAGAPARVEPLAGAPACR